MNPVPLRCSLALLSLCLFFSTGASASETDGAARLRTPFPEPLVGESSTNIEGTEAGELEFDVNAAALRPSGGSSSKSLSVEAEWRVTDRLGVMLEAGIGRLDPPATTEWGIRTGLSWSLLHDPGRDFHLQAEVTGRFGDDEAGADGPIELPHPYSAGIRAAIRSGSFTARAGAGAAFGDGASLFAQMALLWNLSGALSKGFAGVEVNGNVGSGPPLSLVPQLFVSVPFLPVPTAVGLGIPWSPALRAGQQASIGGILRLVVELD